MRRRSRLGLVLAAVSLSHAACGRTARVDPHVELTWTLRPAAATVGPAALTLTVRTSSGEPISGATVRVEGHMTHAGMAPVIAQAIERAPDIYEAAFAFTMPGDWALLVTAVLPDGTRVERRIDVPNVRPSG